VNLPAQGDAGRFEDTAAHLLAQVFDIRSGCIAGIDQKVAMKLYAIYFVSLGFLHRRSEIVEKVLIVKGQVIQSMSLFLCSVIFGSILHHYFEYIFSFSI
jgi:hypothetical protein